MTFTDAHVHISLKHYVLQKSNVWYSRAFEDSDKPDRSEAHEYTQADVLSMIRGNVSLAMAALYPLEDIADIFAVNRVISKIFFGFKTKNIKSLRKRFPTKYALLNHEYDMVTSMTQYQGHRYHLVIKKDDLDKTGTKIVLTLEGGHGLQGKISGGKPGFDLEILSNLKTVKQWSVPVFWLTICHFQYNHLCGQSWAVPLPGAAKPLLGRSIDTLRANGPRAKITPLGFKVIQLALDETQGKRILIDLKHATATARREYYSYLDTNYPTGGVPVIASHSGVSGIPTFQRQIQHVNNEKANEANRKKNKKPVYERFNPWEINLCDEDILAFFQLNGLIGVSLDQRILGATNTNFRKIISQTLRNSGFPDNKKNWHTALFLENIFHIVMIAGSEKAWKMICIGSDNDGIIDPIDSCPTVLHFQKFLDRCLRIGYPYYQMSKYNGKLFITNRLSLNKRLRSIFRDNLELFVKRNFR